METAKVDIRKLQLLNDRINQTIDALHQVRLSVHAVNPTVGQFGAGANAQQGVGQTVAPFGTSGGWNLLNMGGFQSNPYAQIVAQLVQQQIAQQQAQLLQQQIAQQQLAQQLAAQAQFGQLGAMNPSFGTNPNFGINPQLGLNPSMGLNAQQGNLSHSGYGPSAQQYGIPNVFGALGYGNGVGGVPQSDPFSQQHSSGFSHSGADPWESFRQQGIGQTYDPLYMTRLQGAFPFAHMPFSPMVGATR